MASVAEHVKGLMKKKDEIEAEIKELNELLDTVRYINCCFSILIGCHFNLRLGTLRKLSWKMAEFSVPI